MDLSQEARDIITDVAIDEPVYKYDVNGIQLNCPYGNDGRYELILYRENVRQLFCEYFAADSQVGEFLKEVQSKMLETGNVHGIDIINSWFLFEAGNLVFANSEIEKIQSSEYGYLIVSEPQKVFNSFKELISSEFRNEFIDFAAKLIPQMSPGWQDRESLKSILSEYNVTLGNSIILDLGTGMGASREDWESIFPENTFIGLERQYIKKYFGDLWRGQPNAIADVRNIPIATNSVGLAIMEFVAQYMSPESLELTLAESFRVLKEGGCLAITPQNSDWKVYRKEGDKLIEIYSTKANRF